MADMRPKLTCSAQAHQKEKSRLRWVMGVFFIALITAGWFVPWFGYFVPVCMLGGLLPAFFYGRKWCDWWCARGSFLESAVGVLSGGRPVPKLLRGTPFRVAIMGVLFAGFGFHIVKFWGEWVALGGFFVTFLTATTIVATVLGLIYSPRGWCAFCPIGTISHWAGANRKPLRITSDCTACGLCAKVCPMGIVPHEYREQGVVTDSDCLKCGLCIAQCPRDALTFDTDRQEAA